jgi:hypothetical protein
MTLPRLACTDDVLAYEAPFLLEKLCKEHITETSEEAHALFTELKKYLLLTGADDSTDWSMYSLRVDEAWHQFVLFTREYMEFCLRFFGRYIQHSPGNAPKRPVSGRADPAASRGRSTFHGFKAQYEALFEAPLPDAWYDEKSVNLRRRLHRNRVEELELRTREGLVELVDRRGEIVLSVGDLAADALGFVTRTPSSYVRELPGSLTDDEKVGLAATLVEFDLVRVAP